MIRIDEIYNNTLWPWIKKNHPGVRLWWCEPFGRTDPDSLVNYGNDDIREHNYTLLWDQEPIHLNIHMRTFESAIEKNIDITDRIKSLNIANELLLKTGWNHQLLNTDITLGAIITSE
jgi:hypothetical protein